MEVFSNTNQSKLMKEVLTHWSNVFILFFSQLSEDFRNLFERKESTPGRQKDPRDVPCKIPRMGR